MISMSIWCLMGDGYVMPNDRAVMSVFWLPTAIIYIEEKGE
jgi:hypothetical protein